MTMRANPRLLKRLLKCPETYLSKLAHGHPRRTLLRPIGSCCALMDRRTAQALVPLTSTVRSRRSFINLAAAICPRRMEYSECRTFGYTPEQIYNIVANVDEYSHFVPWCKKSRTAKTRNGQVLAELMVGFPPVLERYISELTYIPNHQVRAVCRDGSLFRHLETLWSFSPGPTPNSCNVEFFVSFEFKSLLHSRLAGAFLEEVAKEMITAFESRAAALYRNNPTKSLKKPS
ncbi:coenzyme Q-binding protein COQ10 homolog, mitochondrial-like [Boleophthalmus pectinirostris]|uniref:coenzyme Q-binding protein COQ10 homolog, mitochondrial-like n=1 Tax=Boleophthalmus pectinirostris TaxID=150288 RepID=UPI000A1C257C|nr:coenzyme Q-binding protein COQ10 homolog, mitochondrial-like [Boleophthalmus pectinirostris]